jgi:hypothetical protein
MAPSAAPEDFVVDARGLPLSRGYVSTPEEHWARVVKDEIRKDFRNYVAFVMLIAGAAAGSFGWVIMKQQERLERSLAQLDSQVRELETRTDSVAWKVTAAGLVISDYTGRLDNVLNDYRDEFTRTVRETADLRGSVSSTVDQASRMLADARSARETAYVMGDSVGRSIARVDAALGSLEGDLSRVHERVGVVTERLDSGGSFDLRQGEPFDLPTTPLRVRFDSRSDRSVELSVFSRVTGSPLIQNAVHLSAGQSILVPHGGDRYRLTLVQVNARLVGRGTARFHVAHEPPR